MATERSYNSVKNVYVTLAISSSKQDAVTCRRHLDG